MKSTFFLKSPYLKLEGSGKRKLKDTPCLVLFTCYFKEEEKKFVYSTGEKISPKNWDFDVKYPIQKGVGRPGNYDGIRGQLDRYIKVFRETKTRCSICDEDFTSQVLKEEFDKEFKKVKSKVGSFFRSYDEFMNSNIKKHKWAPNTIKRYNNIKNLLESFQNDENFKLTFKSINDKFYEEFTDYCFSKKKHSTNTFRRNLKLVKAYMNWAVKKKYTFNEKFREFENIDEVFSQKVALSSKDLTKLMSTKFEQKKLERARDVFVFECCTGLRYGEMKFIGEHSIADGHIVLKEEKNSKKTERRIPLNNLSRAILVKYNYNLPLVVNQKQNEYLKDIFKDAGYNHKVEKVIVRGSHSERKNVPFSDLISTHTARRTFITMMKNKKYSDKLIAKITGHKDLKTLNKYYHPDDDEIKSAVSDVFDEIYSPLSKVN